MSSFSHSETARKLLAIADAGGLSDLQIDLANSARQAGVNCRLSQLPRIAHPDANTIASIAETWMGIPKWKTKKAIEELSANPRTQLAVEVIDDHHAMHADRDTAIDATSRLQRERRRA